LPHDHSASSRATGGPRIPQLGAVAPSRCPEQGLTTDLGIPQHTGCRLLAAAGWAFTLLFAIGSFAGAWGIAPLAFLIWAILALPMTAATSHWLRRNGLPGAPVWVRAAWMAAFVGTLLVLAAVVIADREVSQLVSFETLQMALALGYGGFVLALTGWAFYRVVLMSRHLARAGAA
jgi:hypothetical protein